MKREEIKKALPILQAFADGKTIQWRDPDDGTFKWHDLSDEELIDHQVICYSCDYRIKPSPKYRPFKDAEECWQEMLKHQPFGWVKSKEFNEYCCLNEVLDSTNYKMDFADYTFADGAVFGVKEMED